MSLASKRGPSCFLVPNWQYRVALETFPSYAQESGSSRSGSEAPMGIFKAPWAWQPTPVFLSEESQGWGSLVGCHLWGLTESDTTEAT